MKTLRSVCLFALCSALALGAQAQAQWKWRDAQGKVQYSDLPPPQGTPEKDILARPAKQVLQLVPYGVKASSPLAAAPMDAASAANARREAEAKARTAKDSDAKIKEAEQRAAAVRAENCKTARQQLATLESGIRIAQVNEKGERVIMDDNAKLAEAKRARDVIASECK